MELPEPLQGRKGVCEVIPQCLSSYRSLLLADTLSEPGS